MKQLHDLQRSLPYRERAGFSKVSVVLWLRNLSATLLKDGLSIFIEVLQQHVVFMHGSPPTLQN